MNSSTLETFPYIFDYLNLQWKIVSMLAITTLLDPQGDGIGTPFYIIPL